MEKYEELKNLVASMEDDATKFYEKGNKAAGVRLRKTLQDVKTLAQNIRLDVSTKTKTVKA